MSILVGIREFFFPWTKQKEKIKSLESLCLGSKSALAYKIYALEIATNRIANSLSMANFETYKNGKLFKDNNWWLFNYEPNVNQNKNAFWQSVVREMVWNPEGALIIQSDNGQLIVADNYDTTKYSYVENIYRDIELPGGYKLERTKSEGEVFHLKLNNGQVKSIVDGVYDDYGKLIGGTIRNYNRGNAMKVIVKIGAMFDQYKTRVNEDGVSEFDFIIDDIMESRMSGLLSDNDSATPIEEGLEIQEVKSNSNTKSGAVTTRDIADTFDDILNIVADAFHIPRGLMKGDVADVEAITNNYLNLCVNPIAESIEAEINRKLYGKELVTKGTRLRVDTSTIITRDPVKFASSAEALFRIGAYNTNDIRRKMGEEPIDEAWADEYYVTLNYERAGTNEEI